MLVLISDANILIDLEEGGILHLAFQIRDHEFAVPDVMFEEELQQHHPELPGLGLNLMEVNQEGVAYVFEFAERYPRPSRIDLFTMALARQENCPLLTGDKELRQAAEQEGIDVKGTIWLVEQLIPSQLISIEDARDWHSTG
ncbi:MAG: PIN domain-containing protein [Gammaproteobacteria bacterium]|nr:PIN domain-containing protein [Gammaproteobacteria bacterium]